MKKFVCNILLFSLLLVASLAVGEWWARRQHSYHADKERFLLLRADSVETLVLGNSHNLFSFKPSAVPEARAFNMAILGQPINYDLLMLETYLPDLPRLKRVIINCDWFAFFDHPFESYPFDIASHYLSPYLLHTRVPVRRGFSWYAFEICSPPRFRAKIVPWLATDDQEMYPDSDGYVLRGLTSLAPEDVDLDVAEVVARHTNPNPYMQPTIIRSLVAIDSICAARGIELVLVATPLLKEYRLAMPESQIRRHYEILDSLAPLSSFRYLDYTSDPRFKGSDFNDPDHLRGDLAPRFSRILWHDVTRP